MKQAIDIEDLLVWAYRDMEADKVAGMGWTGPGDLASSWGAVDRASVLGAVVRVSPYELLPGDCDDAAMVHDAVMALDAAFAAIDADTGTTMVLDRAMIEGEGGRVEEFPGERARITGADGMVTLARKITISVHLLLHARSSTRPDCYADVARRRGRPSRDGEIAPGLTFAEMMHARAVYAVWHAALGILATDLTDRLTRWAPQGPKVSDSPWLLRTGRVLEAVSSDNSAAGKPLKAKRKRRV
ncbi:hypothetical protein FHS55_002138 [Angulomicrobium tetraedrale]|uniref:Uncharacterized protein n=1 Tax=Ancylobacter tetraedralis TaxID=217068 RepID=A0A839Z9Y0_9HYPH|nr:hypothetical protein [Ancylobacter tetraedralis]MBB3771539.1 hypothetical protein [Ancylobacter tetraedralis]